MPPVQWNSLFVFTVSPFELFIRGSIVYLLIFTLMRILRREPGTVGIADLLMVVLIADASQNAMSSEYKSVLDGLTLILTIVFWNYLLDWLTHRFRRLERFTYPDPLLIVDNGVAIQRNMRKQFITPQQLMSMLREHGVDNIAKVKSAHIEGSGKLSVIPFDENDARIDEPERKVV